MGEMWGMKTSNKHDDVVRDIHVKLPAAEGVISYKSTDKSKAFQVCAEDDRALMGESEGWSAEAIDAWLTSGNAAYFLRLLAQECRP